MHFFFAQLKPQQLASIQTAMPQDSNIRALFCDGCCSSILRSELECHVLL